MAQVTHKGKPLHILGELPQVGSQAPLFQLTKSDLSPIDLNAYAGKRKILNIYLSVDTPTCAKSVEEFYKEASGLKDTVVLNISADLPFALSRYCCARERENIEALSTMNSDFPRQYGVLIQEGALKGLCARAVLVLDEGNRVLYQELVQELSAEPNYQKAMAVLKQETAVVD